MIYLVAALILMYVSGYIVSLDSLHDALHIDKNKGPVEPFEYILTIFWPIVVLFVVGVSVWDWWRSRPDRIKKRFPRSRMIPVFIGLLLIASCKSDTFPDGYRHGSWGAYINGDESPEYNEYMSWELEFLRSGSDAINAHLQGDSLMEVFFRKYEKDCHDSSEKYYKIYKASE